MKTRKLSTWIFLILILMSCKNDDSRDESPGVSTTITGNVRDYHRNINFANFEVKLIKYYNCGISGNLTPIFCEKEIAKVNTDNDGNYILNFDYNLKNDENYRIELNQTSANNYVTEFVSSNGMFSGNYETSNLVKGQSNTININAWKPIRLKFNLNVLNNNTPPLVTGIEYKNNIEFGTELTSDSFKTFELKTRPNSDVKIKFWYIVNYSSSNPIFHYAPVIDYHTSANDVTELNYTVNCNDF